MQFDCGSVYCQEIGRCKVCIQFDLDECIRLQGMSRV